MRKEIVLIAATMLFASASPPAAAASIFPEPVSCSSAEIPVTEASETSDGVYHYKNFVVDVPEAGDYHVGAWLIPAKHADHSFTIFKVFANGEPAGRITPEYGNWQSRMPDGQVPIGLHKGRNVISFGTARPEIPEVETIRVSMSIDSAAISPVAYEDFLEDAVSGLDIVPCLQEKDTGNALKSAGIPSSLWDMELRYSFYKKVELTQGQNIFLTTSSSKPHIIDMMYCGQYKQTGFLVNPPGPPIFPPVTPPLHSNAVNPGANLPDLEIVTLVYASSEEMQGLNYIAHSEELPGSDSNVATLKVASIPKTGVYLIRLRTTDNNVQGTADLHIDNEYYFDNCPISCSRRDKIIPADGNEYVIMTKSDNSGIDDPMVFIHGNRSDRLIGWNDNGPYDILKDFGLYKRESYIRQIYRMPTSSISVSNASSSSPVSRCDVITYIIQDNSQPEQAPFKTQSADTVNRKMGAEFNPVHVEFPGSLKSDEYLNVNSTSEIETITVSDLSGNMLSSLCVKSNSVSVPVSSLNMASKGIYVVSVTTCDGVKSGKILVK